MKFLITGAGGQLGHEWIDFLINQDADFTAYSSTQLDITSSDEIMRRLDSDKPSVIINCAAYTAVDKAETESEKESGNEKIGKSENRKIRKSDIACWWYIYQEK